ncbi:hypothetical protein ACFFLZ_10260 [Photobacterium aphoticum]|uniref:Uncharacterized protein n=1 Tax=Photobacterium aphoticum TaxID=754436 RepID=A0A0J1GFC4_9GAMM|nr:hypothetical protein [Photobacterium aphoticum]KLU98404.1 hypothetical protein ABT58_22850 [Photobacterium aphoticum]PSU55377.1 hypothetical protein C9I90_16490 [Photobacterium aphoticum]GHA67493.1 hypothetical protein GCM10007086_46050 [Photobacterium aphoticum]
MPRKLNNKENVTQPTLSESPELATEETPVNHFANVVLNGMAKKLSPKTENKVFYELAVHDDLNAIYLRISGNEGGGLHSKEWIALDDIFAVLDSQKDKPFKSTVLKSLFKGGSANNVGFLAACLRDMSLTVPAEKSVFLHSLTPEYEQRCEELRSLVKPTEKTK